MACPWGRPSRARFLGDCGCGHTALLIETYASRRVSPEAVSGNCSINQLASRRDEGQEEQLFVQEELSDPTEMAISILWF